MATYVRKDAAVTGTGPNPEAPKFNDQIVKIMELTPSKCSTDGEMVTL
jgi:hypothetical protein